MSGSKSAETRESAEVHRHKFFAPTTPAGAIRRSAIIERVLQTDAARVVLLQGPAGHGKSTTLQQLQSICRERGNITAWLTLDEGDNDTRRFYQHVQAMVAGIVDSPVGDSGGRRRSDWLIERLQAAASPVVLVLDDFLVLT